MGSGNPIKKYVNAATDFAINPIREASRIIGADGATDALNQVKDVVQGTSGALIDQASGKANQMKKEAKKNAALADASALAETQSQTRRALAASDLKKDQERMAAGSRSRTLLTGGSGLEDEEDTITRRTLSGM